MLTDAMWRQYDEDGFLALGRTLSNGDLKALQDQIDAIMLGHAAIDYDSLLMQLDSSTGEYDDAGAQSMGHKGSTLSYRKIQNLEHDRLFGDYVRRPLFREICDRVYGEDTPVSCFRAMFMNKPSNRGTKLPWHQDAWSDLDRQPLITVWTALDPATKANGCVEVVRGSHRLGLVNPAHNSGFLTADQVRVHCPRERVEYIELDPGEAVLLHNWLLHSSDVNRTPVPRRAFSVCYMDARTVSKSGVRFTPLFDNQSVTH